MGDGVQGASAEEAAAGQDEDESEGEGKVGGDRARRDGQGQADGLPFVGGERGQKGLQRFGLGG